jgi:hypothetical protein
MATLTENINYLQPTGFKLVLDRENYPNLEFFAQAVMHPEMMLSPAEMPFRKIARVAIAGGTIDYGELSITVILDEDMNAYTEMHDWMRRLVDNNLKGPLDRDDLTVPSTCDITLSILNSHNNVVKQVRYLEAVPSVLGSVSFESTSAGVEFLTCQMSFRFSIFELV